MRQPFAEKEQLKQIITEKLHKAENEGLFIQFGCTLVKLSRHIGVCRTYLSRYFKYHTEFKNFNHYLNHKRIEDAQKILIQQPDILLKEIYSELGYKSERLFYNEFKKVTGKSPKYYIKEYFANKI